MLQIYRLFQNLTRTCTTLLVKRKLDLLWHEYIEIIAVCLVLTSLILIIVYIFTEIGKYKIPITDRDQFSGLINYNVNFRFLAEINAMAVLLTSLKIIVILRNKFSSFGILFDTMLAAKTDIFNFLTITMILLMGYTFMAILAFGRGLVFFATMQSSFRKLFDANFGQSAIFDQVYEVNGDLSAIFLISYLIIFYFIMRNAFLAIIISTYQSLRLKTKLVLEAKAEMLKQESTEFFHALVNLIFFRVTSAQTDALEYEKIELEMKKNTSEEKKLENLERMRMLETLIVARSKLNLFTIFQTNFGRLTGLNRPALMTQEQNINKTYELLKKIMEEKKLKTYEESKLKRTVSYNFNMIIQMIIYVVYMSIFIEMIFLRLRITDSYQARMPHYLHYTNSSIPNGKILSQINYEKDVFTYLRTMFGSSLNEAELYNFNYYVGHTRARITFQQYISEPNINTFSNSLINLTINQNGQVLNSKDFRGFSTQLLYYYIQPGTKKTFKQAGGYVFYLYADQDTSKIITRLQADEILGVNGSSLAIE